MCFWGGRRGFCFLNFRIECFEVFLGVELFWGVWVECKLGGLEREYSGDDGERIW